MRPPSPMRHPAAASCRRRVVALVLVLLAPAPWCPARGAELPTGRPWQRQLRDFLAGLVELELEVALVPARHVQEALDDEAVYRDWLLLGSDLRRGPERDEQPDISVLTRPASEYLLASIERGAGTTMSMRRHSPMGPAWWLGWDHPGNPYHGERPVALRAIVPAAVDLILVAEAPDPPDDSDLLALHLVAIAYAYLQAVDALPADVQGAFEAGIGEVFERLERRGPPRGGPSLGMAAATASAYVARAVDDADFRRRAEALAGRTVAERVRAAGYVDADGAFDPQRCGGAAYFLVWAALAAPDDWTFLDAAVERMALLKTHLLLPEPGQEVCFGPTHFSPEGTADGFQDDWGERPRDVSAAMLSEPALCLLFGDRPRREGPAVPRPAPALETPIREGFLEGSERRSINAGLAPRDRVPGTATADTTGDDPWTLAESPLDLLPLDHDYYRRGTFARFRRAASSPLARPPLRREGVLFRAFDEEILVARLGSFAAVVHAGPIQAGPEPRGFSGGALAAFWTPTSGATILGRRHDPSAARVAEDSWDNWWRWQTHALAGTGADGLPFSSARLPRERFTTTDWMVGSDRASITLAAPLHAAGEGGNDAVVAGALAGAVTFRRRFDIDTDGVTVETRLTGDGADRVSRLCEILPVFDSAPVAGRAAAVEATVFADTGSGWQPLPDRPVPGVRRVRIDRREGAVEIAFERPQRLGMAPEVGSTCRNILVELLRDGSEPLTEFGVTYTIRPLLTRR